MFLGQWDNIEDLINDFEYYGDKDYSKYEGIEILLAYYLYEDYSGEAFVLFRKDGVLYEVNGSHCSCYGLEGQWDPEETSVNALKYRYGVNEHFGTEYGRGNTYRKELKEVLDSLG